MAFHENIEQLALENDNFRKVVCTGEYAQVVLMSLQPGEEIGEETHDVDQMLCFVEGEGEAILEGRVSAVHEKDLVFVPAGTKHNFRNTSTDGWKLYSIYAPPEHPEGTIHRTKEDADAEEAEF
jgi:mannose-6-phosphate isomerase-like protein (cupin superfamily)